MTLVVLPYPSIRPGQLRDADQIMGNFNAVKDVVNGNLADDNFAAQAAINQSKIAAGYLPSKLGKEGAVNNMGVIWNAAQGKWQPSMAFPAATYKTGVENLIQNIATEQTWASFTVPAGALGTNRILIVKAGGTVYQNTGVVRDLTLRIKYGTTTLFQHQHTYNSQANNHAIYFSLALCALSSTSQRMAGRLNAADGTTAPTSGQGELGTTGFYTSFAGTSAENSAGALTFAITVQMAVAAAAFIVRRNYFWAGVWQ